MSLHPPRSRRATRRRLLPLVASLEDRRLLAGVAPSIVGPVAAAPAAITAAPPAVTPTSTDTATTRIDSNLSAPAINLGDSYWGGPDSGRIALSRRTDQFVIGLNSGGIGAADWVRGVKSQVGVLSNVALNRSLSPQILVVDAGIKSDDAGKAFEALTRKMDAAAGQAGVAWVAPVFRTTGTGSDLV
ncbi:MAG: hypothetical protein U0800_18135, partial [Isosphaeraceae bacterium]